MRKIGMIIVALALTPAISLAQSVGTCGWGSKLFDGEKGIAPQVLAVTTNGTSGNQTFGISSGTSGCQQNGIVKSNWRTAAFVGKNQTKLARDISRGEGEALNSLAFLLDVDQADQGAFKTALKSNFGKIFSNQSVSTEEVLVSLKSVLSSQSDLAVYSARV